jgi:hypothetical protein
VSNAFGINFEKQQGLVIESSVLTLVDSVKQGQLGSHAIEKNIGHLVFLDARVFAHFVSIGQRLPLSHIHAIFGRRKTGTLPPREHVEFPYFSAM